MIIQMRERENSSRLVVDRFREVTDAEALVVRYVPANGEAVDVDITEAFQDAVKRARAQCASAKSERRR